MSGRLELFKFMLELLQVSHYLLQLQHEKINFNVFGLINIDNVMLLTVSYLFDVMFVILVIYF